LVSEDTWKNQRAKTYDPQQLCAFGHAGILWGNRRPGLQENLSGALFQVLANLAMEPPIRTDSESVRDEKVKVLNEQEWRFLYARRETPHRLFFGLLETERKLLTHGQY
jgi:hypothetical protein